jgi:predicted nucleic acid-binding protein
LLEKAANVLQSWALLKWIVIQCPGKDQSADIVLVDTSIWVTHQREGNQHLETLLLDAAVLCHPFIVGELACGNLRNRNEILSLLQTLPMAPIVEFDEFLHFIDRNRLVGIGMGFVDVHLLALSRLAGIPLWTSDKTLMSAAINLDLKYRR